MHGKRLAPGSRSRSDPPGATRAQRKHNMQYKIITTAPLYLEGQRVETSQTIATIDTTHPIDSVVSSMAAGFATVETTTADEPASDRFQDGHAVNDIGLDVKVSEALVAAGIQTVGEARAYLAEHKTFKDLTGIGKVSSDLIAKLIA
jgi:hypothetical protein